MRIYLYDQNCTRAGSVAIAMSNDEKAPNGDVTEWKGTERGLISRARAILRDYPGSDARNSHLRKSAQSVLAYLGASE